MHDTIDIANLILSWSIASDQNDEYQYMPVNSISLQKMLYIANAILLFEQNRPIIRETPIVGHFDPVFPSLGQVSLEYGVENITALLDNPLNADIKNIVQFTKRELDQYEHDVLFDVAQYYDSVGCDHKKLTLYTGGNRQQWDALIASAGGYGQPLSYELIKNHYISIITHMDSFESIVIPEIQTTTSNLRLSV